VHSICHFCVVPSGDAGMVQLQRYAQYVDQAMAKEEAPGCESCTANRMMLEKVSGPGGGGGERGLGVCPSKADAAYFAM
jgi:hypothetical protein